MIAELRAPALDAELAYRREVLDGAAIKATAAVAGPGSATAVVAR